MGCRSVYGVFGVDSKTLRNYLVVSIAMPVLTEFVRDPCLCTTLDLASLS